MKNKLLFFALTSLLVVPVLSIAQTTTKNRTESEERGTIKNQLDAKKEELKQEMKQKREELGDNIQERKHNAIAKMEGKVNKFVQNVIERNNAAIERFTKLADRIDSRIAKLDANKIDTTKAKSLMVTARAKIETAKASIALIKLPSTVAASTTASTTVSMLKEAFQTVQKQIEKAKTDLKAAHAALVNVIENIKPGQEKLDKMGVEKEKEHRSATSTATTTKKND